ncbi:MAG: hypothetical protein KY444_08925, partial [Gemmatimonadetes bacterium]|nr:hypothetical protein [Gemmatimonadota bacterium]
MLIPHERGPKGVWSTRAISTNSSVTAVPPTTPDGIPSDDNARSNSAAAVGLTPAPASASALARSIDNASRDCRVTCAPALEYRRSAEISPLRPPQARKSFAWVASPPKAGAHAEIEPRPTVYALPG